MPHSCPTRRSSDLRIETIDAGGHDADAADEHVVLVERQVARIGAEAERRAFGTNEAVRGGRAVEAGGEVGARELAELDAEQRSAFEPARGGRGREMLLHDHARRARRKTLEEHTSELQSLMRTS